MGKALGGGSGWVLLAWSERDQRLVHQWASDHTQIADGRPLLALDMYEHAYTWTTGSSRRRLHEGVLLGRRQRALRPRRRLIRIDVES